MAEILVELIEVHRYLLTCPGCPKTAIIETDDKAWLARAIKDFKKEHRNRKELP